MADYRGLRGKAWKLPLKPESLLLRSVLRSKSDSREETVWLGSPFLNEQHKSALKEDVYD